MTDEQLVAYLDAAIDRRASHGRADFAMRVEAARMGAVFASGKAGQKAYARWRRSIDKASGKPVGLSGAALEAAVMGLRATNPEYVVVGE